MVEDDRDIRDLMVEVLEGEGYPAFGAANGREALAYCRKCPRCQSSSCWM